jgi:isopenicillin-N epimerase
MLADPLAGVDCDVWVGNLHKFGCAPRGSGVLVARGPVREQLCPLVDSWGTGKPFPVNFDEQGTQDFTSWLAAPDALDAVEREIGWDRVRRDATDLVERATDLVAGAFAELTGEDHRVDVGTPAVPFRLVRLPGPLGSGPGGGNALRDRVLAEFAVECAFTGFGDDAFLRLSAHAYNTLDDYADFAQRCVPALVAWSRDAD